MSKGEAATVLACSVRQVERLIADGRIVAVAVGSAAVRIRRSDLETYIADLQPKRGTTFRDDLTTKESA